MPRRISLACYAASVSEQARSVKALASSVPTASAEKLAAFLGKSYEEISASLEELEYQIDEIGRKDSMQESADYCCQTVLPTMEKLRAAADKAEAKIPDEELPYPTYDALLFSV